MIIDPVQAWHDYVLTRDPAQLKALLHPEVVFESPVVHTPQQGRDITSSYIEGALQVLGNPSFQYLETWRRDGSAILEFTCTVEGISVNGIDMFHWNDQGMIIHFKVMVRPLKAINILHLKMGEYLASRASDAVLIGT